MITQLYQIKDTKGFLKEIRAIVREEVSTQIGNQKEVAPDGANKYCTINEACKLLKTSKVTIYERIKEGKLNLYKDGNRSLLLREEVENLPLKSNKKR